MERMNEEKILSTKQKALAVNLEESIYGTFAEIGAGQETVRNFFRAGKASGTICKTMSAYDKEFSDAIYGEEPYKRYVTQERLKKMLAYETNLIEKRLSRSKHPNKLFFAYANTVATSNVALKFQGHGWVGIRFQLDPLEDYNEIVLHIRFLVNDPYLQQEALGVLGVNLIYGAFFLQDNPKKLLMSLRDNLRNDKIEIDMINFSGARFMYVDNRLMSLMLMKYEMTQAVIFGPDGNNILPAEYLYKKNILTMRGSFRPVTNVNMDMLNTSLDLFKQAPRVDQDNIVVLFEITLNNLKAAGSINERDFLERADVLCSLGQTVLISGFQEYYKLMEYYTRFTDQQIGLTLGVTNLIEIFNEKYYDNLSGGILEAFGKLFMKDLKLFLYPYKDKITNQILNSGNLKVHPRLKELYKYFKRNGNVVDITDYQNNVLHIFSRDVCNLIQSDDDKWQEMVPKQVADDIINRRLFGYKKLALAK